eukprot:7001145-Pyramimonas_sp.AAC.1
MVSGPAHSVPPSPGASTGPNGKPESSTPTSNPDASTNASAYTRAGASRQKHRRRRLCQHLRQRLHLHWLQPRRQHQRYASTNAG